MEKIFIEKIILSYNAKYYAKSLKVKLYNITGLWMKKKYSEENIVSVHWQILQLLILAVPVCQVSQKKKKLPQ